MPSLSNWLVSDLVLFEPSRAASPVLVKNGNTDNLSNQSSELTAGVSTVNFGINEQMTNDLQHAIISVAQSSFTDGLQS